MMVYSVMVLNSSGGLVFYLRYNQNAPEPDSHSVLELDFTDLHLFKPTLSISNDGLQRHGSQQQWPIDLLYAI
jgi:hypothetical protein